MNWLAPITRHLIAPAWAAWERSPYLRHHRRLLRTQFDPPETIRQRQWHEIESLLDHAYRTTRFWRGRLADAGLEPGRIRSFDDFRAVPLLTKADLRERAGEMLSDLYRNEKESLHKKRTSGSTGVSVEVLVDEAAQQFKRACVLRSDEWSGWRLGERVAAIWGNPQVRTDWKGRLRRLLLDRDYVHLDTLKMDEAAIGAFADALVRTPPSLLFGHAHSLHLFAVYLKTKRPNVAIRPRGIISAAMVLHDWERRLIEAVFQCPVTNRYGCEEVSLIACECERHDGLHVNADGIYLEVLRPDGTPCPPGEPGMIVVTDLVNRAMPMIRYQVGDMGVLSDRQCPCGRGLPLLERIEGRVADYVVTPRGELISGISLTENFAVMVPGIAQLQIVQEEVDRFVFRIVKGSDFGPKSLETIGVLVKERFGPEVRYECEYVDRIPQEPSGKYRFCISKVEKVQCSFSRD
ncbi:MAG: phenylacetate--CoA ligase family protein [Planctomycetia bacterium]|nr:phenylacetate--CoA ligase family protein [Planctomycetia bacterium]